MLEFVGTVYPGKNTQRITHLQTSLSWSPGSLPEMVKGRLAFLCSRLPTTQSSSCCYSPVYTRRLPFSTTCPSGLSNIHTWRGQPAGPYEGDVSCLRAHQHGLAGPGIEPPILWLQDDPSSPPSRSLPECLNVTPFKRVGTFLNQYNCKYVQCLCDLMILFFFFQ